MKQRVFETIVGAIVISIAVFFVNLVMNKTKILSSMDETYLIEARFSNAEGIDTGSNVSIAGVKIGVVLDKVMDQNKYNALVKLKISNDIKIPKDSNANIVSSGLLGDKFITIEVGAEEENLKDGDEIKFTQSSVNLESLISKMIFSKDEKKSQ